MRLRDSTVAVVGLGLMGGSLALALRGKCARLVGVARRPEVASLAARTQVVDAAYRDIPEAVRDAGVVVLATPVCHILQAIPEVAAHMRPGALLLDLGSTKARVVEALGRIPEGLLAVGGHPMCGKEVGGLESADGSLFRSAPFVFTPTARTTDDAMPRAFELAEAVGARPLVLDAERHDRAVAVVSHLPYLLAASLVRAEMEASAADPVVRDLAASGFRDTTRLAASQVEMMLGILLTNREAVELALDVFERKLADVRSLLDEPDSPRLRDWMVGAQQRRREIFT
jgi:prephenate dehydrogenase